MKTKATEDHEWRRFTLRTLPRSARSHERKRNARWGKRVLFGEKKKKRWATTPGAAKPEHVRFFVEDLAVSLCAVIERATGQKWYIRVLTIIFALWSYYYIFRLWTIFVYSCAFDGKKEISRSRDRKDWRVISNKHQPATKCYIATVIFTRPTKYQFSLCEKFGIAGAETHARSAEPETITIPLESGSDSLAINNCPSREPLIMSRKRIRAPFQCLVRITRFLGSERRKSR